MSAQGRAAKRCCASRTHGIRLARLLLLGAVAIACGGRARGPERSEAGGPSGLAQSGAGGSGAGGIPGTAGFSQSAGGGDAALGAAGSSGSGDAEDPFAELPKSALVHVGDIDLAAFMGEPEDLYVDAQGIRIVTLSGEYVFSVDGALLSSPDEPSNRAPALGIDGAGRGAFATVYRNVVSWYSFEHMVETLAAAQVATGIALDISADGGPSRFFVTDSARQRLSEYLSASELTHEVELPGTDPQGVAISAQSGLFVLDARRLRILRVAAGVVQSVAEFPPSGDGIPTGIHFDAQNILYVCYKKPARVSMFSMGESVSN